MSLNRILWIGILSSFLIHCSNSNNNGKGNGPIVNTKPGQGAIYVVGDSLAYGTGGDSHVTPAGCLQSAFPQSHVLNKATPGLLSSELLSNTSQFLNPAPQLVFISTGGNDSYLDYSQPGSYPTARSVSELEDVIKLFQAKGTLVVYLGINPPFDPEASAHLTAMSSAAASLGVIVVDGMNGLWNSDKMSDMFHPNTAGYQIMCDRILQAVRPHYP